MALRLEDRDLVIAYQAGDDEAFAELVREYRPKLLSHARRRLSCDESAEDAVQETLVRALRAMPRFNGNYRVGPWLNRILINVCIDEGNRRRREGEKTERAAVNDASMLASPSAEVELGLDIDNTEVEAAVEGLSESYREALRLRFVEQLDYDEVAQAAGVSEDNARARVSRARNALRAALRVAAFVPVALVALLRRGERAASALSGATPGAGRSALHSATPLLVETGPVASRAAAAVAGTAATGVPVVAKAAMGLGLATAVLTPTVDSPLHRAAERVLPDSVMEVLAPLALEVPAPDAPVVVPTAATPIVAAPALAEPVLAAVPVEVEEAAVVASAAAPEPAASAASAAAPAVVASDARTDGSQAATAQSETSGGTSSAATPAPAPAPAPVVTVVATSSVEGAQLTFTPAGADRYDVSGTLSMTVQTTTTTTTGDEETVETTTSTESVAVVSPSTASLDAADPAVDERRFSALLVFAPGADGTSAEMRLAARGTENGDGSLSMTGVFSATPTESLPLAARGNMSGTLTLDADGMPASLTVTLTP